MIVVVLKGGLGNQMFQYAFGLAYAKKYNISLVLDTTLLNDHTPRKNFTYRSFGLDIFSITPRFTLLSKLSYKFSIPVLWAGLSQAISHIKSYFWIQKRFVQKEDIIDTSVLYRGSRMCVEGYFQSEKYFIDAIDDVREAFVFKNQLSPELQEMANVMMRENSVCLHVRRGDYVANPLVASTLGFIGEDYYARALDEMKKRVENPRVYVFSDDIEWCREHLPIPTDSTMFVPALSSEDTIHLMSYCRHTIMGNSTYAWWAAWLSESTYKEQEGEQVIIAPSQWAKDGSIKSKDIIPKRWIRI